MLISVINRSRGELSDEEVQEKIRAVNRQITEDFAPAWGMSATLRLEGTQGGRLSTTALSEMRGDAVLYLCSGKDASGALGYHEKNYKGVPYGFVFLGLSKELEEPWSVTLSHEALELIADPETNLLVVGPHPEDPKAEVMHWYEVCDAVQADTYEIDGVPVSNFVLPLYFTSGDEKCGRNDFLGVSNKRGSLKSFGVRDGGYVGYFDPRDGGHHTFAGRLNTKAKARLEAKAALHNVRRGDRYQEHRGSGGPELGDATFEAFAVRPNEVGSDAVEKAVLAVLGKGWSVEPLGGDDVARVFGPRLEVDEAWDKAHQLSAAKGIASAEPHFLVRMPAPGEAEAPLGRRASGILTGSHLPSSEPSDWALRMVNAPRAWDMCHEKGVEPGEGIVVGHPDTGYTRHQEIWCDRLLVQRGWDFLRGDDDAVDELESTNLVDTPGHGSATASLIMSGPGAAMATGGPTVTGVAPAARLVPFRVSTTPVHFSMSNVTASIRQATARGCHVISMSLGGLWSYELHRAVREAADAGVIVVSAAGNFVRIVVWPARFEEVVAVAACNADKKAWVHSSRGDDVDITAPGESVWRARASRNPDGSQGLTAVERSSGTSYATAIVAGAAAVWLSYHGRANLIARYGQGNLGATFQRALRESCQLLGFRSDDFGAGLLDVASLLSWQGRAVRGATVRASTVRGAMGATTQARREPDARQALHALGVGVPATGRKASVRGRSSADPRVDASRLNELAFRAAMDRFRGQAEKAKAAPAPAAPAPADPVPAPIPTKAKPKKKGAPQSAPTSRVRIACQFVPPTAPGLRRFQVEGPWNIKDPVHESILEVALRRSGLVGKHARFTDPEAWEYVRGVFWNDDPLCQLFDRKARRTNDFSSGITFAFHFGRFEKDATRGRSFGPGDSLLARSHFGDLQFLHAMAQKSKEPAAETKARVLDWAGFTYEIARGGISPSATLGAVQEFGIAKHFPGSDRTVRQLFGDDPLADTERRALGSLLHVLQDSYAAGHVDREAKGKGRIVRFHCYTAQDHAKHDHDDAFGPGNTVEEKLAAVKGALPAIDACAEVLTRYRAHAPWNEVREYLDRGPLALASKTLPAGAGADYE